MRQQLRSAGIAMLSVGVLTGGVVAVDLADASAAPKSHTIIFVAHEMKDTQVGRADIQVERDTSSSGKAVGYDVTDCLFDLSTGAANCQVSVGRSGGFLYGRFHLANVGPSGPSGPINGTVTGGTGAYRGATGRFIATVQRNGTTRVVLTYAT